VFQASRAPSIEKSSSSRSLTPVCDVAQHQVGDAIEDVVLVGHVVVQRHRLDPDLPAEPAHGQRVDPALVGKHDGGA